MVAVMGNGDIITRMSNRRTMLISAGLLLLIICVHVEASGQDDVFAVRGGDHTLFGDLKIDESQAEGMLPQIFHLVLVKRGGGSVISRQPISNNGRYRFTNISNGEYDIIIEVEGAEVLRVPVLIHERFKTDVRRDIELQWRADPFKRRDAKGTVSASPLYERKPPLQEKFERAHKAIDEKDYARATDLLRQLVKEDPRDFVSWNDLGTLLSEKDASESENCFRQALEGNPKFTLALLNMGRMRLAKKDYEKAVEYFSRAVEAEPQSADANHLLGEAFLQNKKGSKAVGYLNEALRLEPDAKADIHLRLAALYHGAGYKDMAASEYERFLAKRPDHPERKKFQQYISENKGK